jgi:hypothetical protein
MHVAFCEAKLGCNLRNSGDEDMHISHILYIPRKSNILHSVSCIIINGKLPIHRVQKKKLSIEKAKQ